MCIYIDKLLNQYGHRQFTIIKDSHNKCTLVACHIEKGQIFLIS